MHLENLETSDRMRLSLRKFPSLILVCCAIIPSSFEV